MTEGQQAFVVGQKVRTSTTVNPGRYAAKEGRVIEVRPVAPGKVEVGVRLVLAGAACATLAGVLSQWLVLLTGAPWLGDNGAPGVRRFAAFSGPVVQVAAIAAVIGAVIFLARRPVNLTARVGFLAAGAVAGAGLVNVVETAMHSTIDWLWLPNWVPVLGGGIADLSDLLAVMAGVVLSASLLVALASTSYIVPTDRPAQGHLTKEAQW